MDTLSLTVRVYGLLQEKGRVLLSRENIHGDLYTKFPGGGLEPGEGVIDCLKREFMEEAGVKIMPVKHYYTTEDFFQSAFHHKSQVISIYYMVECQDKERILTGNPDTPSLLNSDGDQILYWCNIKELMHQKIELPIDKIVAHKLLEDSDRT